VVGGAYFYDILQTEEHDFRELSSTTLEVREDLLCARRILEMMTDLHHHTHTHTHDI